MTFLHCFQGKGKVPHGDTEERHEDLGDKEEISKEETFDLGPGGVRDALEEIALVLFASFEVLVRPANFSKDGFCLFPCSQETHDFLEVRGIPGGEGKEKVQHLRKGFVPLGVLTLSDCLEPTLGKAEETPSPCPVIDTRERKIGLAEPDEPPGVHTKESDDIGYEAKGEHEPVVPRNLLVERKGIQEFVNHSLERTENALHLSFTQGQRRRRSIYLPLEYERRFPPDLSCKLHNIAGRGGNPCPFFIPSGKPCREDIEWDVYRFEMLSPVHQGLFCHAPFDSIIDKNTPKGNGRGQ